MVSPIGREVDRGGGTAGRQNQRVWECNELLHKRVSERQFGASETFELIGMAKHGKRKESNVTPRLRLISRFFHTLLPPPFLFTALLFPLRNCNSVSLYFTRTYTPLVSRDKQASTYTVCSSSAPRACSCPHYRPSMQIPLVGLIKTLPRASRRFRSAYAAPIQLIANAFRFPGLSHLAGTLEMIGAQPVASAIRSCLET